MSAMISHQGPDQILDADSYSTTKADGCIKLRMDVSDNDLSQLEPISVPGLLQKAAKESPDVTALTVKRDDQWIKWTYKEYLDGKLIPQRNYCLELIFISYRG